MSRVMLTGATGFIGRRVPAELAARGYEVHAVSSRPAAPSVAGVEQWHRADLLDPATPARLLAQIRPAGLLHLAWYVEPGQFWTSEQNVLWLEASLRLLRAFLAVGGQRAVLAGTCAEYDWSESGLRDEHRSRIAPGTLYGACKDALRSVGENLSRGGDTEFAWGRIFFPYGPGEPAGRLVPSVARAVLAGQNAPCSRGAQIRDFVHVADVAGGFAALFDSGVRGPVNIASGEPVTVADVARRVGEAAGAPLLVQLGALADRSGEPADVTADVTVLRDQVGFRPRFSLSEGVADTVDWWRGELLTA